MPNQTPRRPTLPTSERNNSAPTTATAHQLSRTADGFVASSAMSRLGVPTTIASVLLGVTWLITGGLSSCDSTARFGLDNVIFDKVQVVSAFPAFVDPVKGTVTRVCGAPLNDQTAALQANGLELTVNLVSTDLTVTGPKCSPDRDQGIREGDRIEQQPVSQDPELQTISASAFELAVGCYEPRSGLQDPATCSTSASGAGGIGKALKYKAVAPARCDPYEMPTWQNVAILVDHSGSTGGNIFTDTGDCTTANVFKEDLPGKFKTPKEFTECSSDRHRVLAYGATSLIDALNPQDRVLTMYFDESNEGVRVACTDDLRCQKTDGATVEITNKACVTAASCPDGYQCAADPSFANDNYANLSQPEQMSKCFGKSDKAKAENKLGLEERTREIATGRAPIYEALSTAYNFLRNFELGKPVPRHIVLLTDGPDSCTYSDLYQFADPKVGKGGDCRKQCAMITTDYKSLLQVMDDDKYPVRLHVVQMQSKSHPQPDAYLQDLACRTEGTYQFLNTLELNNKDPSAVQDAMSRAVAMVRFSLAGNWRVGFQDNRFKDDSIKKGSVTALRGAMKMKSTVFSSLEEVFKNEKEWQFTQDGQRDRRMIFHLACSSDADCGGTDSCGANHCSPAGECISNPAPDLLPCGTDGKSKCCNGACKADGKCEGACKG